MDEGGRTVIIYHGKCSDGFCAAWVARKAYPNAQFVAAQHGQSPPDVKGKNVFMLDFAYPRGIFSEMKQKAKSLTVLDHHKSAAKDLADIPDCFFDMKKSGASMAWDFFKGGEMPWLVSYTEDRDLWKFKLPCSKEINAALESFPFDFNVWDAIDYLYPTQSHVLSSPLVNDGRAIMRFQERQIETIAARARPTDVLGHKVLMVNATCLFAHVAGRLAKGMPFGVAWHLREDGKYVYSLRSEPNTVDVSAIAAEFGGGGHENSAGFVSAKLLQA